MADPPNATVTTESFTLQQSLKTALIATTRTTSALCAEDLPFHRSLDRSFAVELDRQNARLLALADRLLDRAAAVADVSSDSHPTASSGSKESGSKGARVVKAPRLRSADELDTNWRAVVDVVDSLLERTDGVLDEVRGVIRKGTGVVAEAEKHAVAAPKNKKTFQQAANILKPQRNFANPPNNFATGPWKPILTRKPHAKVPLEESLRTEQSTDGTARQVYGDNHFHSTLERDYNASYYLIHYRTSSPLMKHLINTRIRYKHPYQTEIEEYKYPPSMYLKRDPIMYTPYDETTATFVDTEEAVEEMLEELRKAKEIAIDLEHHDQRTYVGVVCLMQISTREKDWVVDTLKPWRRKLECLNEVFADPGILKVLHGSAMDVIWLQRDLGLYLVGVFDTEHAATALHYPKRSLAFLLEKHVNFTAQKQYQLADWRVRPFSKELFDYARSDTHFLLYVFDCLRNELLADSHDGEDGDLIARVLRESKRYQMQRYENPFYDSENGLGSMGWYKQLFRTPALLSKQQFAVFKAVHQWRDNLARAEDESLPFVMSNHLLQTIAREMPVTKEALLAATPAYAALVRSNADRLIAVVAEAKERGGREGLEMREQMAKIDKLADEQHNNKWAVRKNQELEQKIKAKIAKAEEAQAVEPVNAPKRAGTVDVAAVKAEGSAFWGSTLGSMEQRRQIHSDVRLSLPMPEVSGDVFLSADGVTPIKTGPALPSPVSPTQMDVDTLQQETGDVFVLREKGKSKKRKAHDASDGDELKDGADEVDLDVEKAQKTLQRNQRRAEKEEKRRAREEDKAKANKGPASGFLGALHGAKSSFATAPAPPATSFTAPKSSAANEEEGDDEPFDYANAPSVLAAGAGGEKKKKRRKGRMEGLDPYKKALDTGKGVPRGQRERVGEGATFRK